MATTQSPSASDNAKLPFWKRSHYLDRMTLSDLVSAYFQHYTIICYICLAAAGIVAFLLNPTSWQRTVAMILATTMAFPLAWHMIHQFIMHAQWPYKHKWLASTWKRIHYDHHQDPNHLEVLFGALYTTVPTITVVTAPVGALIAGEGHRWNGAALTFAVGILCACYYEFMHCIEHLSFKPKWKWVQHMKQRHNEHHYVDENGNFGITNFFWDHVLGTYYEKKDRPGRSATVFNLGYTEEVAAKYPWVKALQGGVIASNHPIRRALLAATPASAAPKVEVKPDVDAVLAHATEAIGLNPEA